MDIIDVTDFTQTLQKSVTENLAPEFNAIKTDIVKKFQEAILEGNYDIAIETVGDDKVKALNQNLAGSSTYFQQIRKFSEELKGDLSSHVSKSDQLAEIGKKRTDITNSIAERQTDLKEVTEQTIPGIQLQLEKEQEALLLLNVKDSAYDSQKDKVKQIEETLSRANTKVADYIGQIEAATHFRDTELATLEQIANTTGVSSDRSSKLNQHLHKQVKLSDDNLKKNQELLGILEKQGDAKKKLVEQAQPILEEYEGMLDGISQGIDGFFGKFPLVGGMLSAHLKKPLEEATDLAKKSLRKAFLDAADAADKGAGSLGAMAAGTKSLVSGIAGMGKAVIGALLNPFALVLLAVGGLLSLLKSAYDEMGKIEKAGREFRFSMGASAESALQMRDMITANRDEFIGFGVSIEDSTKAASALGDVFSSHNYIQKDTLDTVVLLEKQFGIAAESSAAAINNVMKIGGVSAAQATKIITHAGQVASKHGLNFAKIMDDVANAGDDVLLFSGGSAKNLTKAAVEARKMGTSIGEMASAADNLLDFESSINAQMSASTMLGRNINLNRLRALAMEGDAEGMAKEQLRLLKEQGGIRSLNRFQQKSLAEAMGVELSTLYNLEKTENQRVQRQADLQKLAAAGNELAIKQLADQEKKVNEIQKSSSEVLAEELRKTQEIETQKAMQDKMNEAMLKLKTTLIPVVNDLMPTFLNIAQLLPPIFSGISTAIDFLTAPFQLIVGLLNSIQDGGKSFSDMFSADLGGISKLLVGIIGVFMIGKKLLGGLPNIFTGIIDKIKGGFGGIMDMVKSLGDGIGGTIKKLADGFGSALGSLGTGVSSIVKSIGDGIAGLANGIGKGIASIFDGIGKGIKSLVNSLGNLSPANMVKAAVGLLVLAGAMYVSAKAFQEFAKVSWEDIGKGLVGILGLTGIAVLLSKASASMIQGAAAVALLGIALIPAAYAFQMFSDVSWKDVIFGGIAIGVLAAAAFGLGLILGPIALGAAAIALLGASIIPLAFALNLAAPALESFGKVFLGFASIMVKALEAIIGGIIEFAKVVGGVIVNVVKSLSGIITAMGDAIVGAITAIGSAISGIITSIANGIATVIGSVSGAITAMVDDITRLSEIDAVNLIAVAGGIGAVGVALASFGVGGGVGAAASGAGNAVGALGNSIAGVFGADTDDLNKSPLQKILDFAKESESIILVSDKIDSLLDSFDRLAGMESILETAASALQTFGDALSSFGAGNATAGIGNAVGAMGNAVAGMFGADAPQDPIDQLMGFIDKLGSIDLNVESLEILSSLNLGGFLNNITDDFGSKIEMVSDGLGDFINVFESVQPTTIASIERVSGGLTKLLNGLSRSLPKIKTSDSKNLVKVADGLDEFFNAMEEVNTSKIKILPEIGVSMIPFIANFSELPLSSISEDISSIMNDLGDGIYQFFDELAPTDLTILPHLVTIQQAMIPFLKAFAQAPLPSEGFDSILIDLGKGIEQFADYVNDGEAGKINTFFKQTGAAFPKFVESMSKLSSIGDLSIVNKLTTLSDISNTLNLENVNKLKAFTSEVVDAINSFAGIQDPAVEALSAITSELYMMCDVIEKLDVDKLGGLQNINLGGVQTPIKIPARKSEQQIIEGTIGPKLMMTEMADLPVTDVAGGSLPPSDPFDTSGPSLADVFSTPLAETQVQQVADTGTTSLADVFSTPLAETQVQQVADTGTTSLADVFSSPPPEMVTEQKPEISILKNEKIKDAKKLNETVQPIVDIVGNIYTKFIPDSIKQKLSDFAKTEYFNLDEDHSMKAYKRSLGVNESVTENILGDMGVMSAKDESTLKSSGDKVTENEFTSSMQYEKVAQSTGLLDQIMAGILKKELPTKLYAEGQLVGMNTDTNQRMYTDEHGFSQVEQTSEFSVTDVSEKLANNVGSRIKMLDEAIINGTTLENDSLNKLLESRRQQLTDEGRLVVNKIQNQVEPINNQLQPIANQPTIQNQVEPMNVHLQETATAPTSMLTKIADFTNNLIPDFSLLDVFSDVDKPESSANIELSGLDTISVKGHNIFVEEIAKIVNKNTPSVESEKTEDGSKVVKKLDELILLMRKGGISVNMDGRKVSRAVASAHDQ